MKYTDEEKKALLKIARSSIQSALDKKPFPETKYKSVKFDQLSGVFVTLRIGDDLRGCIGYVEPFFPLSKAVQEAAVKAAVEDTRFMPLTSAEFKCVTMKYPSCRRFQS